MYVGRIVAVGRTKDGRGSVLYRVSSRSFPNRTIRPVDGGALVVPREGFQDDIYKNPYIAYRCLQLVGDVAIASNGSQTDPVADKVRLGVPVRDAIVQALMALDYEKDNYNTPRIISAIAKGAETGFLGIVRHDGITVRELPIEPGKAYYIATYETNDVSLEQVDDFDVADADAGALHMVEGGVFANMEHPVCSACALETADGFDFAAYTVPTE